MLSDMNPPLGKAQYEMLAELDASDTVAHSELHKSEQQDMRTLLSMGLASKVGGREGANCNRRTLYKITDSGTAWMRRWEEQKKKSENASKRK